MDGCWTGYFAGSAWLWERIRRWSDEDVWSFFCHGALGRSRLGINLGPKRAGSRRLINANRDHSRFPQIPGAKASSFPPPPPLLFPRRRRPSPRRPSLSTMSANEKERGPDEIQEEPSTPVTTEKKKREYKDFGHEEEKATRMYLIFSRRDLSCSPSSRCQGRHVHRASTPDPNRDPLDTHAACRSSSPPRTCTTRTRSTSRPSSLRMSSSYSSALRRV